MTTRKLLVTIFITVCCIFCFSLPAQTRDTPPPSVLDEQPIDEDNPFMEQFLSMLMMLGFVVVVIVLMGWVMKKLLRQRLVHLNKTSMIKVLERRNLAPKTAIYLIEIGEIVLVVGESPQGLHRLGELSDGSVPTEDAPTPASFSNILAQREKPSSP